MTTRRTGGDRSTARSLITTLRQSRGSVARHLRDLIAGNSVAEGRHDSLTDQQAAGLHPAHAAYVRAQNRVSALAEELTALDELDPFVELLERAQASYMPEGPPISPLTLSYFNTWLFFDARLGRTGETMGTLILELGAAFGMRPDDLRLIRQMQESRMGLYVHEGLARGLSTLRELETGTVCHAIVPAGYPGRAGELWYARVLSPPLPEAAEHVVFTTPYVVLKPGLDAWEAYLARTLRQATGEARRAAYERHLKFGPKRYYWHEYVFEGYAGNRREVIYLAGLPDVPESRPHSDVNR